MEILSIKNPIDDIPIPAASKGQKTFEEMLEEELAKEPGYKKTIENSDMKKSFLKRKIDSTAKKVNSTTKKSYKYYVDNFHGRESISVAKKLNFEDKNPNEI
jgi:hypothetical protein